MEGSKIKHRNWVVGIYLFTLNIKVISSIKLHRELGIGHKATWFMFHRLRIAFESETGQFIGPAEVDEKTYAGGKWKNMSNAKRKQLTDEGAGRGLDGNKVAVVGIKNHDTNEMRAELVNTTTKKDLRPFIYVHTEKKAKAYTDDATVYNYLPSTHKTIKYSVSDYDQGQTHTNGIKSFWTMLKRHYHGIYHKMSSKHLDRFVTEFVGWHNDRRRDSINQMDGIVQRMQGKRLRYDDLIVENGLPRGARG